MDMVARLQRVTRMVALSANGSMLKVRFASTWTQLAVALCTSWTRAATRHASTSLSRFETKPPAHFLRNDVFVREHEYDQFEREIARLDSYGNRLERAYDSLGFLTKTLDPLRNVVRYEHNAFGELVQNHSGMHSDRVGRWHR